MKRLKKIISGFIAAATIASVGTMNASAERGYDIVDMDNIVFSIRKELSPLVSAYEYTEFVIDGNYNINGVLANRTRQAVIRMTDGSEPELTDGLELDKFSKYQIGQIVYGSWGSCIDVTNIDIDIEDDIYFVNGFKTESDAQAYCDKILESGKADYAERPLYISWNEAYGEASSNREYLSDLGIDADEVGMTEETFGFELIFDSAEEAESFDISSIEGFEENLHASFIKDNVMYFQLTKEAEGEEMVKVLLVLQQSEAVKELDVIPFYRPESVGGSLGGIPEDYPMGDTDYNNSVNLYDVINIAKHIIDMEQLDELQQLLADYDNNGEVNLYDAIEIADLILKQ